MDIPIKGRCLIINSTKSVTEHKLDTYYLSRTKLLLAYFNSSDKFNTLVIIMIVGRHQPIFIFD